MGRRLVLLASLSFAGGLPALADVVTTKDGLVLEGTVERTPDGGLRVRTDDGDVQLSADAVASVAPGEGPRTEARRNLATLPASDVTGRYRVAVAAQARGLDDVARDAYASVLAAEPDHPAARRALGYERVDGRWMTTAQARAAGGLVLYDGRWMLPAEVDLALRGRRRQVTVRATDLVTAAKTAATGAPALAAAAERKVLAAPRGERLETATGLLVHSDAKVRTWAARELGRLVDESAMRPLFAVAARDRDEGVRHAAVAALAAYGRDDVALPFVRALWSEHPSVTAHAAQALAWLGDPRAVVYVVKRVTSHGGSPRANFSTMSQRAYVQDFDVEVAQTSYIADPQIGVVQEGAVQDVQVLDASIETTWVETVLVRSVASLAKVELADRAGLAAWWKENEARFPGFPPVAAAAHR